MTEKICISFFRKAMIAIALTVGFSSLQAQTVSIPIVTQNSAIVLQTDNENRLRTTYFGEPIRNAGEYSGIAGLYHYADADNGIYNVAYTPSGT